MEEWKDIPGYEGCYQVSSYGRVKNLKSQKILDGYIDRNYRRVRLLNRTFRVHQLVAMAFLSHKQCGMALVVDHINANTFDNRLCNLQILTNRQNCTKDRSNKLKTTGVRRTKSGKYSSHYRVGKRLIHLGTFDTLEQAHDEYLKNVKLLVGQ